MFSSVCGKSRTHSCWHHFKLICRSKRFTIWEARAPQHWRIWHGLPGFYECNVSLCAKCLYCFRECPLFNSCNIVRITGGETCVCAGCIHVHSVSCEILHIEQQHTLSAGFAATSSGTLSTDMKRFGDGNNNGEFLERFHRLKALYNLIKEKHGTCKYPHSNQWYINKQT